MKLLVTGATGLVGNNVVRQALERGDQVRVLARATADLRPLAGLDLDRREGDVRDEGAVRSACSGVDVVVHAAAMVHIGWMRLEEQRQINVDGTRNVARAAQDAGARLIHVSSVDALAPGAPGRPVDENDPLKTKVPCGYVVTKRESELEVERRQAAGLRAVVVNPGFMLGPWDWKPSSGRMVLAVAEGRTRFAPWGGLSVCDVRDVAGAILTAADRDLTGRRYILAGHNMTYRDLWREIAAVTHGARPLMRVGPAVRFMAGRAGDLVARFTGREPDVNSASIGLSSLYNYYRSDRAIAELDYRIRPYTESIEASWNWLREHGYA